MASTPVEAVTGARQAARARRLPPWAREPLVHFVILGAALFAADHFFFARPDESRTIVMPAQAEADARALFRQSRGREPDRPELEALRRVWTDNEVLYREGLAMRMDRGDPAIRERIIFKALSMVDAGLKAPSADEKSLAAWFEASRVKYDEPARFDFQEAVLYGAASEAALREFAEALNRGAPGDAQAGLRVFKGRPHDNIVQSYGEAFAKALESAPQGTWNVYRTRDAWRIVRLESAAPGKPASFDALRGVVMHDYIDAKMAEQRTGAVRQLARKYTIRYEGIAK